MPSFCRHSRLEATCPICSRKPAAAQPRVAAPRAPRTPRTAAPAGIRRSGRTEITVRRLARAADDGYEHELLPGVRASADAARLADELAFADGRLAELRDDPPGLYADVALAGDREEAAWLCLLIAYLSPLEDTDPFAAIAAARTTWASGELPRLDDVALGPRSAHDPRRGDATLVAYRDWAARAGTQERAFAGEPAWTPERRFDRAFERLALPGLTRAARFELLVLLGALGVADVRASSLQLAAATGDATVAAAKRVFGIGDAVLLGRRASALSAATGVALEALDLALVNVGRDPGDRVTAGARVGVDDAGRRAAIAQLLGVE